MAHHAPLDGAARARLRTAAARAIAECDPDAAMDCATLMPAVLDLLAATEQALLYPETLQQASASEQIRAEFYAAIALENQRQREALVNVQMVVPALRAHAVLADDPATRRTLNAAVAALEAAVKPGV